MSTRNEIRMRKQEIRNKINELENELNRLNNEPDPGPVCGLLGWDRDGDSFQLVLSIAKGEELKADSSDDDKDYYYFLLPKSEIDAFDAGALNLRRWFRDVAKVRGDHE